MKHLIVLVFVAGLVGCNNNQSVSTSQIVTDSTVSVTYNKLFAEFLNSIPSHELPLQFVCGLPEYTWADEFNKYKTFLPPDYDAVYGLIGQTQDYQCIMFGQVGDDIYPTLFTFDNNGKRIDSLYLILSPCGAADETVIPLTIATIDKDLNITLQDTLRYIHYPNPSGEYVVDSIMNSMVIYTIDNNGRMIKNQKMSNNENGG